MAKEASNGDNHVTTKPSPEPVPLRKAKFFQVIIVDNYFTGSKDNLRQWIGHPRFELIRHDVTEPLLVASPTSPIFYKYNPVKVDGIIRLMEVENTINIGNPGEFTMLELAETVKEMINPYVKIITVENTPDNPRQRKPYITKAKELLGWEPTMKLRNGLHWMEEDFCKRLGISRKN